VLVTALETKRTRQWKLYALYALLLALGMYTHYFFVLLWMVHVVWLVWRARRDHQPVLKSPWLVALAGSLVLFAPWLPVLVTQVSGGTSATVLQPLTIDNLVGIVSFAFLYQPAWLLDSAGTIIVLFIMVTLGVLIVRAFQKASKKERDYLWLLTLYLLVPLVIIALACLVRPFYIERYISHVMIGALLAALLLYVILLLGISNLAVVGNTNYQRLLKPAADKVAAQLMPCDRNSTILAADPYVATELSYYLPSCEVRFYSPADALTGGYVPLAGSPLRIADPSVELTHSAKLYYVYYDKPRLTMPTNLVQIGSDTYGALSVDTFVSP
jgi:hypothetical protein